MILFNFGLFGFTYTRQKLYKYPMFDNCIIKHKIQFLNRRKFKQLKTFLSW